MKALVVERKKLKHMLVQEMGLGQSFSYELAILCYNNFSNLIK